jgi:hypothetical protein
VTTGWAVRGSNIGRGKRLQLVKKSIQTGYGTHPASYSVGTGDVKMTTLLHLVPTSRMGGTTRLMSLHVLMAWTGKLYLCLYHFTGDKSHF